MRERDGKFGDDVRDDSWGESVSKFALALISVALVGAVLRKSVPATAPLFDVLLLVLVFYMAFLTMASGPNAGRLLLSHLGSVARFLARLFYEGVKVLAKMTLKVLNRPKP